MQKLLSKKIIRYLIVGGSSVAVDYMVFLILYRAFGAGLQLSLTTGFIVALFYNFALNKYWAFSNSVDEVHKHGREFLLYGLLVIFNLAFTNIFVAMLKRIGMSPEIGKLIATAMITLWNYYLYKTHIFSRESGV